MAISITVSGVTQQQGQDIGNAFDVTIEGRAESGLTKQQWVEFQMKKFLVSVVKGWKRKTHEAPISAEQAQVENDFQ